LPIYSGSGGIGGLECSHVAIALFGRALEVPELVEIIDSDILKLRSA
jgi:hypothetical protein